MDVIEAARKALWDKIGQDPPEWEDWQLLPTPQRNRHKWIMNDYRKIRAKYGDDAAQEAFIKIESQNAWGIWVQLGKIAKNAILDYLKAEKRQTSKILEVSIDDMTIPSAPPTDVDRLMMKLTLNEIWISLEGYNERDVLKLYFSDGLTRQEVADHLGISKSRVMEIISTIRTKSRTIIGETIT